MDGLAGQQTTRLVFTSERDMHHVTCSQTSKDRAAVDSSVRFGVISYKTEDVRSRKDLGK